MSNLYSPFCCVMPPFLLLAVSKTPRLPPQLCILLPLCRLILFPSSPVPLEALILSSGETFMWFLTCSTQATVARAGLFAYNTEPFSGLDSEKGRRQAQWETVIGLRIVLEWRQVEVGGSQQVQLRPCDEGCYVVLLDSSLFWPFQQKSSWAEWLAYISSCDPPPPLSCTSFVIYTQELLAVITRQTPPARVQHACVCVNVLTEISACVIPCMVEYLILPACMCSWYICMCAHVGAH